MVPARFVVSVFVFVAPLVFRAPSDPAVGPGCWLCPWAAARPRAVRAASFARRVVSKPGQAPPPPTGTAARPSAPSGALHTGGTWCAGVWPGQDPPPLTGAAARPRLEARPCPPVPSVPFAPAGLWFWCARPGPATARGRRSLALCFLRRPPHRRGLWFWCARPGPAATHGHRSQHSPMSHVIPLRLFQILNAPRWNCNVFSVC